MPIYVYSCSSCNEEQEVVRPVSEHTKTIPCDCGDTATQKITPLHIIPDIEPYRSMVTGERIRGRSHHRTHLRDHNCIEVGNERIGNQEKALPPVGPDIKRAIEELKSQ